jgi:predicted transcriptional regulator of viral defense system
MASPLDVQVASTISTQPAHQRSDRAIERAARSQHGVITLVQLERLGISRSAVRDRVATGRLKRLHRGVYTRERPTREARWMAAVLAMGEHALLSHRSAAALWGLCADHVTVVELTTNRGRGRSRPGLVAHHAETLLESDRAVREGVPCTALPRTLLDLAAVADTRTLARALERAEELRMFDLREVDELLSRSRRRHGAPALRAVVANLRDPTLTRSEAEERMLAIVIEAGLPKPEVNVWMPLPEGGGYRPDLLWRDLRLIVEVDGRAHHARRRAFEHDRRRDRRLALAGYETRRYSAAEVLRDPERVASELRALLDAAAARLRGAASAGQPASRRSPTARRRSRR